MSFRRLFPYVRTLGIFDLIDLAAGDSNELQPKYVKRKKQHNLENLLGFRTINSPFEAQFRRNTLDLEISDIFHSITTSTIAVGIIYNIPNELLFPLPIHKTFST
jgi:hypothetical protein